MAYEHLYTNAPIEKTLNYGGKSETVYFRRLTAGEHFQIQSGQKGSVKAGDTYFDIDLGEMAARNQKKLAFSNCTADGKAVFKGPSDVKALPSDLFDELFKLMEEALAEKNEGNG